MLDRPTLTWYRLARERETHADAPFAVEGDAASFLDGDARRDLHLAEAAIARLRERVQPVAPESPEASGELTRDRLGAVLAAVLTGSDQLALGGFGVWTRRRRKARQGRNPRTGETIEIPGSSTIAFKSYGVLQRALTDERARIGRHPGSVLAIELAGALGVPPATAADRLQVALQSIVDDLRAAQRVTLKGFGTFALVRRKTRHGRNPRTGEQIEIPGKTAVRFETASEMKAYS